MVPFALLTGERSSADTRLYERLDYEVVRREAGLVHLPKPVWARGHVDESAGQDLVTAALDHRTERRPPDELGAAAARRLMVRGGWDW